jgi:hypothetical protein
LVGTASPPPRGRCDGASGVFATLGLQLERVRAAQARGTRVEVWFQDEARIGQKNGLTRVWGQTGSRPADPKDLGFASAYSPTSPMPVPWSTKTAAPGPTIRGAAAGSARERWRRSATDRRAAAASSSPAPEAIFDLAISAWDPQSDGLIVACLNFRSHPIIDALEARIGKPVVTSTQAVLWRLLRLADVETSIDGFGRLLREH